LESFPPLLGTMAATGGSPQDLRSRAKTLRERAGVLGNWATELDADARKHDERALGLPEKLLPHRWLWRRNGDQERMIDPSALAPEDPVNRRRWEREFDDLHVRALIAYTGCLLQRLQMEADANGDGPATEARREEVGRLLKHLLDRFWADEIEILQSYRALPGQDAAVAEDCRTRLRAILSDSIERDPKFWSLAQVHAPLFEKEERIELLEKAQGERGLPRSLYLWLAMELRALGRQDAAEKAFTDAAASDDPAILWRVAEQLEATPSLGDKRWSACLQSYVKAYACDRGSDAPFARRSRDEYRHAIGRVLWKEGCHARAVTFFSRIRGASGGFGGTWRTDFVRELLDDGGGWSPQSYRILKSWLGRQLTQAQLEGPPETRLDAAGAILLLTEKCYQRLVRRALDPGFAELADSLAPVPTHAILEAHKHFFRRGAETRAVTRMLEKDLPAVRRSIVASAGFELRQVLIFSSETLRPHEYRLLVDELPVDGGRAGPEQYFCPDGASCRELGLPGWPGVNPADHGEGWWLGDAKDRRTAREAGLEVWDRYTVMLRHFEAALLANQQALFGFGEMEQLISAAGVELPPDERLRATFVAVLKRLARDGVPLSDWSAVGEAVSWLRLGQAGVDPVVERVRTRVGARLPGLEEHVRLVSLPPELEDLVAQSIREDGAKRFLALPRTAVAGVRRALDERLDGIADGEAAVVVLGEGLRPFVRRLTETWYPSIPVVSFAELPTELVLAGARSEKTTVGGPP
jgi:flagellar biosynthesis protein FlhA